nr:uncharacterized protein LOC109180246 [Ipomoea batatas]
MVIGASPTTVTLAAAHQPRLCKRNSDSSTPTTTKKSILSYAIGCVSLLPGLAKDSELLKSAKLAHSKEVKTLKADLTKMGANLAMAQEGWAKATEALKGIQRKEIFGLFKAQDATFSPTSWGLLNPVTPDDTQGAEDVALNASVDTLGGEILMDNAYLESAANVDSITRMDRASVPTLTEVGRSDVAATGEEDDPSDALQLNHQRSRSSERNLPTRPSEAGVSGVPLSEA